jgi:hypothetical protein
MAIISSILSFIRFADTYGITLPAFEKHETAFQFSVTGRAVADKIFVKIKEESTGTLFGFSTPVEATAVETDGSNWKTGHVILPAEDITFEEGSCFRYVLVDNADTELAETNLFKVVDEGKYTSLITYRCKHSGFGFYYEECNEDLVNKVRLPFYLNNPVFPKKRTVYKKSDGSSLLLSATMEKDYQLTTDHMTELFHECLSAALIHDTVIIANTNIREQVVKVIEAEDYTPEWNTEYELSFGPAKGRVKVASFGYSNSNCDESDCCVAVAIDDPVAPPNGTAMEPYSYSFDVAGSAPFTIEMITPVTGFTVAASGNTITIEGTASGEVTIDFDFKVKNCSGTQEITINTSINFLA